MLKFLQCSGCFETTYLLKWAFHTVLSEKTHIMGEPELEVSTRAYCKMIMHSAKYPRLVIRKKKLWVMVVIDFFSSSALQSMVCCCQNETVLKLVPGKLGRFWNNRSIHCTLNNFDCFAQNNSLHGLHSPLPHGQWPGSYGGGRAGPGDVKGIG